MVSRALWSGGHANGTVRERNAVLSRLASTISSATEAGADDQAWICSRVAAALGLALRNAGWVPAELRTPSERSYRREPLFEAEDGSFSIGCFAWGPGQQTSIHDHSSWSVVGCAAGTLEFIPYSQSRAGRFTPGPTQLLHPGTCLWSCPQEGDIHRLRTGGSGYALSVHVYGCEFARACARNYASDGTSLVP